MWVIYGPCAGPLKFCPKQFWKSLLCDWGLSCIPLLLLVLHISAVWLRPELYSPIAPCPPYICCVTEAWAVFPYCSLSSIYLLCTEAWAVFPYCSLSSIYLLCDWGLSCIPLLPLVLHISAVYWGLSCIPLLLIVLHISAVYWGLSCIPLLLLVLHISAVWLRPELYSPIAPCPPYICCVLRPELYSPIAPCPPYICCVLRPELYSPIAPCPPYICCVTEAWAVFPYCSLSSIYLLCDWGLSCIPLLLLVLHISAVYWGLSCIPLLLIVLHISAVWLRPELYSPIAPCPPYICCVTEAWAVFPYCSLSSIYRGCLIYCHCNWYQVPGKLKCPFWLAASAANHIRWDWCGGTQYTLLHSHRLLVVGWQWGRDSPTMRL